MKQRARIERATRDLDRALQKQVFELFHMRLV